MTGRVLLFMLLRLHWMSVASADEDWAKTAREESSGRAILVASINPSASPALRQQLEPTLL